MGILVEVSVSILGMWFRSGFLGIRDARWYFPKRLERGELTLFFLSWWAFTLSKDYNHSYIAI
jgi:hypothetical protein